MTTEREQKLVDITFQIAMIAARGLEDFSDEEVAWGKK
jgi:hypothetical protein